MLRIKSSEANLDDLAIIFRIGYSVGLFRSPQWLQNFVVHRPSLNVVFAVLILCFMHYFFFYPV